jgi:hypothetical protein
MLPDMKPISFSTPMVLAVRADAKTKTRRVVKLPKWLAPLATGRAWPDPGLGAGGYLKVEHRFPNEPIVADPLAPDVAVERVRYTSAPGDLLYVREQIDRHESGGICYRADGAVHPDAEWVLRVVDVRVERLQAISEEDVEDEGVEFVPATDENHPGGWRVVGSNDLCDFGWHAYSILWDHINGKRPGCSWAAGPWVWVVSFRRVLDAEVRSWR